MKFGAWKTNFTLLRKFCFNFLLVLLFNKAILFNLREQKLIDNYYLHELFIILSQWFKSQKLTTMEKQIGIWIDLKKAKIITLSGNQKSLKTINSAIETRDRIVGDSKQAGRFGEQYIDNEKSKEQKIKKQAKDFLKTVLQQATDCDAIVVFGPANMKHELEKEIKKDYNLSSKLKAVVPTDSMTDNQTKAWVVDFYKKSN